MVPDVEVVKAWAADNNIPGTLTGKSLTFSYSSYGYNWLVFLFTVLCNDLEVKNLIMNDMIGLGKEFGLKSFEQVIISKSFWGTRIKFNL